MRAHTVVDVMSSDVVTVHKDTGFKDIVAAFGRHAVSAAPVVDDHGAVLGIVTESDLIRKVGYAGDPATGEQADRGKAGAVTAAGLMTAPVVTVSANEGVPMAARLMAAEQLRRMPVVDDAGLLVGMVSARDLLRPYLRDDASIAKEIREDVLVNTLWIDPSRITVRVSDGVVTLLGTVDRRSTMGLVGHLVEGLAGVVDVANHLTYHYDDDRDRVRVPPRSAP